MKTSIKSLLCALALSTTVAFAGPGADAKKPTSFATGIYKSHDGNINVNIEKKTDSYASVSIVNSNGVVLAREGLAKKQSKAAMKFDVSTLPDGEYTLTVLSNGEREVRQFTLTSEKTVTKRNVVFQ